MKAGLSSSITLLVRDLNDRSTELDVHLFPIDTEVQCSITDTMPRASLRSLNNNASFIITMSPKPRELSHG